MASPACPRQHERVKEAISKRLQQRGRWGYYSMAEVQQHNCASSGWIVVEGKVYDITHHVQTHKGWSCGCAVATLLATLRVLGTDCTEEMLEVHSDAALRQLQPYMIGELLDGEPEEGVEGPAVAVALEPECIGQGGARGR